MNIKLRPLEITDIGEDYLSWLNDPKVTQYMTTGLFPQPLKSLEGYFERISRELAERKAVYFAVTLDDKHIGNAHIHNIDWRNRRCDYGMMIGYPEHWGKGICKIVLNILVDYAFTKLNLNKFNIHVIKVNERALNCYKACGFRIEGLQEEMWFHNGEYTPNIALGLTRKEWLENERE